MSAEPAPALDRRVAFLLHTGTWLASAVIAVGLVLPAGAGVVKAGIALFVALPIARVTVMLVDFLRRRDHRIAVIAALVLTVILLGIVLSLRMNAIGG
jgi:uncharacterized membrane protein